MINWIVMHAHMVTSITGKFSLDYFVSWLFLFKFGEKGEKGENAKALSVD